jgi:hypothetical protein
MARDLGWSHTKLNWFVRGYYAPSADAREKIATYLNAKNLSELFIPKNTNAPLGETGEAFKTKTNGEVYENQYPK